VVSASVGSGSGFLGGFLTGFSGGFSGGFASGAIGALCQGAGGGGILKSGLMSGLISGGIAGLTTGFQYGSTAVKGGGNWLTGKNTISDLSSSEISRSATMSEKAYNEYRIRNGEYDDALLIEKSKGELGYSNGDYKARLTSQADYARGYKLQFDGYFGKTDSGGSPVTVAGFTKSLGIGHGSIIHISPKVINYPDLGEFKAVAGHEWIHAIHIAKGLPLGRNSEIVAYKYTMQEYARLGNFAGYLNTFNTAYRWGYIGNAPSVYYNIGGF
jgi:hypothetical protein